MFSRKCFPSWGGEGVVSVSALTWLKLKKRPFLANRVLKSNHLLRSLVSSDSFQLLLTLQTITPYEKAVPTVSYVVEPVVLCDCVWW